MAGRQWDAGSYDKVSGPMVAMGAKVVDRLELTGDETVLDAGCGTGRVTELLLERLPNGKVIALDADAAMVATATANLASRYGDRIEVRHGDLLALDRAVGDQAVDAVLSTATFHWILDHDRLFARLHAALRPGGALVAQCGGAGNIASILQAAEAVGALPRYAPRFAGWERPARYETAEATAERLEAAGFDEVRCWLEPAPAVPDEPHEYLATIVCGAHVERLDEAERPGFIAEIVDHLGSPVTIDYIRLNLEARRPRSED